MVLKFYIDPCPFNYFRFSYDSSSLALNHWHFHIVLIICISALVVLVPSKFSWAPAIPCAILMLFTLIYRPYKKLSDNLRSAYNLLVMSSFVGFRFFIEQQPSANLNSIIPTYLFLFTIVTIGLSSVILFGLISSVYYWYQYRKIKEEMLNNRRANHTNKYDRVLY